MIKEEEEKKTQKTIRTGIFAARFAKWALASEETKKKKLMTMRWEEGKKQMKPNKSHQLLS